MDVRPPSRPPPVAALLREGLRRARHAWADVRRRVASSMWPVLQQTIAAALSWWLAGHVIEHHQPIFAPITTIVALNTTRGGRGTNAVRFVLGVVAGVLAAQLTVLVLGPGYATLAVAVFLAILAALVVGGERITMAQAGVSAVIAVATGSKAGIDRVYDAVLGGAVALVFSQLLFPAHPLSVLRRAETAILGALAHALTLTAEVMERESERGADWTWEHLRAAYLRLADLGEARDNADTAARRSPLWWGQRQPIERESAYAARLDLLGNSCLTLTRTATGLPAGQRAVLSPEVRELAETLRSLTVSSDDRTARQRAAERALAVGRRVTGPDTGHGSGSRSDSGSGPRSDSDSDSDSGHAPEQEAGLLVARAGVRMVVLDLLVFVGADLGEHGGAGSGAVTGFGGATGGPLGGVTHVRVSAPPELRRPFGLPFRLSFRHPFHRRRD
ncbi:FUSC family protein [Streptomyces iconiensis]|uniref:FUSC family protein n=1 Tax=Streptomyces iconiensis TaxID=1384038 RepID=A0ABT6ZRA1_9ACTN|nr:FUSC family protein [Streptomyces iconiensis]MDJ1131304.1 FUSC family protein [Streptomyces iconiensis]